jgi:hypothetical protein
MPRTRNKQLGDQTIVYLPFPLNKTGKHLASSQNWNNVSSPSDVICMDSLTKHAKLNALTGSRDVLYVRGHSNAGFDLLAADGDQSVSITSEALAADLSADLQKCFPGIIKIYGCSTGKGWGSSGLPLLGNALYWDSFGQKFADEMFRLGYKLCSFYAYTESVATSPGGNGNHKVDGTTRASQVRNLIVPRNPQGAVLPI